MSLTEQVRAAVVVALKAHEPERVSALRLVLSELQKAAKEGRNDEVGVLRRERNRRREAADIYAQAGRQELAAAELAEASIIETFLPSELSDAEIDLLVDEAIAQSRASTVKDMGGVIKLVMAASAGAADGKHVSARVRTALT